MEASVKHICMNCMHDMGEYDICAYCGWIKGSPPNELYQLFPGTLLNGHYEVGTAIGAGGFGIIYNAYNRMLGTHVAIKEYYPSGLVSRIPGECDIISYGGDQGEQFLQGKERFLAEARNMAKFSKDPNIVNVLDFFEENNTAYIVMEYLDGVSLKKYLQENTADGKLPLEDAKQIIRPVMTALKSVHAQNIVHRDISPDNIFILYDGRVKLLDFGAARLAEGEGEKTLSIIIKPGYAPHEQYRSKSVQGPFTDIYALGATLYRMLTGEVPVESSDRVANDRLILPSKLNPNIDKKTENTLLTAMSLNANLRFQSIEEMENALFGTKDVKTPDEVQRQILKKRSRLIAFAIILLSITIALPLTSYFYFAPRKHLSLNDVSDAGFFVVFKDDSDQAAKYSAVADAAQMLCNDSQKDISVKKISASDSQKKGISIVISDKSTSDPSNVTLEKLYSSLNSELYHFLPDIFESNSSPSYIPTGFDIPVIYYNGALLSLYDIKTPYLEDKDSYGQMTKWQDYEKLAEPIVEVEECMPIVYSEELIDLGIIKGPKVSSTHNSTALDLFTDEDNGAVMYVGTLKDLPYIQEKLPGYYKVGPVPTSEYGGFYPVFLKDFWQITDNNTKAAENSKIETAMYLISYLLNDMYQEDMYVSNNSYAPLNKETLKNSYINGKYPDLYWIIDFLQYAKVQ